VAAHQSNWELVPCAVLDAGIPFLVTYRAANNPYVDERIKAGRKRYGVTLFGPKGSDGARELLTALGQGTSVGLMNDQKFNRGVPATFFGQIAETAPGPSRLAQRFGADLLPMTVRREHKARFVVEVHEPFQVPDTGDKSADIAAAVQRITNVIEGVVRGNPSEWFWTHKRWPNETYKSVN
jgi:Kdo2-lipid IVA lauroyltransferase/acyltransferase